MLGQFRQQLVEETVACMAVTEVTGRWLFSSSHRGGHWGARVDRRLPRDPPVFMRSCRLVPTSFCRDYSVLVDMEGRVCSGLRGEV